MVHVTVEATVTIKNDDESKTEVVSYSKNIDIDEFQFEKPWCNSCLHLIASKIPAQDWDTILIDTKNKVDTILI